MSSPPPATQRSLQDFREGEDGGAAVVAPPRRSSSTFNSTYAAASTSSPPVAVSPDSSSASGSPPPQNGTLPAGLIKTGNSDSGKRASMPSSPTLHNRSSSLANPNAPATPGPRRASLLHSRSTSVSVVAARSRVEREQGGDKMVVPQEPPARPEAFDFNKFLEQMRMRSSSIIAKYVKSFLREFEKKVWSVGDQVQIIRDFLDFIAVKMRDCDTWSASSEAEFDNALEGMEKLVMNRLYLHTFCSASTDDAERDEILHQKIQIFRWIRPHHLDIPDTPHNRSYFEFAQTELLKMNSYRAPRDKLICILNCCIVIFGLLRHMEGEGSAAGADRFLPILIYVVLRADPEQLVSNVQYISRFRQPAKLESEAGYYLTNLFGVISFLERMEATSLSISQQEFDENINRTLLELAEEKVNENRPPIAEPESMLMLPAAPNRPASSAENGPDDRQQPRSAAIAHLAMHSVEMTKSSSEPTPAFAAAAAAASRVGKLFGANPAPVPFAAEAMESRRPRAATTLSRSAALPPVQGVLTGNGSKSGNSSPEPRSIWGAFRRNSIATGRLSVLPTPSVNMFAAGENASANASSAAVTSSLSSVPILAPLPEIPILSGSASVRARLEKTRRSSGTNYQTALHTLRDMFPQIDPEVVEVVLQGNGGVLAPSIETLLEISSSGGGNGAGGGGARVAAIAEAEESVV